MEQLPASFGKPPPYTPNPLPATHANGQPIHYRVRNGQLFVEEPVAPPASPEPKPRPGYIYCPVQQPPRPVYQVPVQVPQPYPVQQVPTPLPVQVVYPPPISVLQAIALRVPVPVPVAPMQMRQVVQYVQAQPPKMAQAPPGYRCVPAPPRRYGYGQVPPKPGCGYMPVPPKEFKLVAPTVQTPFWTAEPETEEDKKKREEEEKKEEEEEKKKDKRKGIVTVNWMLD